MRYHFAGGQLQQGRNGPGSSRTDRSAEPIMPLTDRAPADGFCRYEPKRRPLDGVNAKREAQASAMDDPDAKEERCELPVL